MQIEDEKFVVNHVRFGKDLLVVNKHFIITSYILNTWNKKKYQSVIFGKEEYFLPQDFRKIERILEEM